MIQIELLTVVLMKIKIYICYILLYTVIYCTVPLQKNYTANKNIK